MILEVYLYFTGNCREAMEFYREVFGGELFIQTHGEALGDAAGDRKDKVMHASLRADGIHFMASDSDRKEPFGDSFVSLSLSGSDDKEIRTIFDKLSQGGKVASELKKEFWGDIFGSVTDKFGVDWMVNIVAKKEAE